MRIALDAMGGDDAPAPNIDGALHALDRDDQLRIALVGDQPVLEELLAGRDVPGDRLEIVPSDGVVGMDEKPTHALRSKPNSSIAVCWKLMAAKEADAVVSAGNTGAVVAAGLRTRLFSRDRGRQGLEARSTFRAQGGIGAAIAPLNRLHLYAFGELALEAAPELAGDAAIAPLFRTGASWSTRGGGYTVHAEILGGPFLGAAPRPLHRVEARALLARADADLPAVDSHANARGTGRRLRREALAELVAAHVLERTQRDLPFGVVGGAVRRGSGVGRGRTR